MQATPGIGEYLAQQRKLRGISVDDLCEITKIPRRNLERLEAGAFDAHPDGFARGFVRTVAAALGLDPDEAVMRLMQEPEADAAPAAPRGMRVAAWTAGLLGVVGALALGWWLVGAWSAAGGDEAEPRPALTYRPDVVGELARDREADAAATPDVPSDPASDTPSDPPVPPAAPTPPDASAPPAP